MELIPFNVPYLSGKEMEYVKQVFTNNHFAGNGYFTKKVQNLLKEYFDAEHVLLTHSCTGALEMSALICDLSNGDEVIMPSFTFVTTASSMLRNGAMPIFCEIDPQTMQIDLADAEKKLTPKTKAIIPVHYGGFSLDMDALIEFARIHDLIIIEDAAQALGTSWNSIPLGSFGPLATISFHETKNIHSGLGGCLIINDPKMVKKAEIIWERGTNRADFLRGSVDKYSWHAMGSSFYPCELQAAFLLAQLESLDDNLQLRNKLRDDYVSKLNNINNKNMIKILHPQDNHNYNAHMMAILLENPEISDYIRIKLNTLGIQAVIHYVPLHSSEMGIKLGYKEGDLPISENLSKSLIRLPLHHLLTSEEISYICNTIDELLSNYDEN